MAKREDGKETRRRLLNAACEVFAQKGYRNAKVAEICRRAGANVASVNYYFGDKDSLYKEAYLQALERIGARFFPQTAAGSLDDQLRVYIRTLIENFAADGDLGRISRLYLMEMVNPTGLIQDAWHDTVEPTRRKLHAIIRGILGADAGETDIRFCELSIVNQCRMLVTVKRDDLEYMLGAPLDGALVSRFADHVADFSLAGIKALGSRKPRVHPL
ncbi:MAG TPA: CerR family C-terminal domain-containing protein [Desulfosarcina sp.]|nr:CerR family C-terminal domain-containing protein [Desulfosarcina sp.]